jgi:hypothetical protein
MRDKKHIDQEFPVLTLTPTKAIQNPKTIQIFWTVYHGTVFRKSLKCPDSEKQA